MTDEDTSPLQARTLSGPASPRAPAEVQMDARQALPPHFGNVPRTAPFSNRWGMPKASTNRKEDHLATNEHERTGKSAARKKKGHGSAWSIPRQGLKLSPLTAAQTRNLIEERRRTPISKPQRVSITTRLAQSAVKTAAQQAKLQKSLRFAESLNAFLSS